MFKTLCVRAEVDGIAAQHKSGDQRGWTRGPTAEFFSVFLNFWSCETAVRRGCGNIDEIMRASKDSLWKAVVFYPSVPRPARDTHQRAPAPETQNRASQPAESELLCGAEPE